MKKLYLGDCLDVLKTIPENSVDSICCDPPYELGFMGKSWDNSGIAYNVDMWKECLRVLKPGGHLLSFSGTRTYHRMAVAIEDAGFEVRDMIEWVYGSGFPKSLNIGKAVSKIMGEEVKQGVAFKTAGEYGGRNLQDPTPINDREQFRHKPTTEEGKQWEGWGTALKPAHEPICLARKPLSEKTVAENVLKWGTGGINIDESRVGYTSEYDKKHQDDIQKGQLNADNGKFFGGSGQSISSGNLQGRFPANLLHDNSEEVRECFPETKSGTLKPYKQAVSNANVTYAVVGGFRDVNRIGDSGNASRFFKSILYYPKASKADRNKGCEDLEEKETNRYGNFNGTEEHAPKKDIKNTNFHPTCKPTSLMSYLIKMITPKGGIVLDPFAGSGSTLVAAKENGFGFIGIELTPEYIPIIEARVGIKAETINKRYLADNKILEQEIIYQQEDNEILNKSIDKRQNRCSCGGRIVKTKSGVLTCESCFTNY